MHRPQTGRPGCFRIYTRNARNTFRNQILFLIPYMCGALCNSDCIKPVNKYINIKRREERCRSIKLPVLGNVANSLHALYYVSICCFDFLFRKFVVFAVPLNGRRLLRLNHRNSIFVVEFFLLAPKVIHFSSFPFLHN